MLISILLIMTSLAQSSAAAASPQAPPNKIEVIVQAKDKQTAAEAGRNAGGEITHELDLINAVVIRVPENALKGLLHNPNVRLFPNSELQLLSATRTARDEFNAIAYNGSNGNMSWDNSWQEIDDLYGPSSGMVQVVPDGYCAAGNCLRLGSDGSGSDNFANHSISRSASIIGASTATLSFSYLRYGSSGSATVTLAVSKDAGVTWTTLASYLLTQSDSQQVDQSFDLTSCGSSFLTKSVLSNSSNISLDNDSAFVLIDRSPMASGSKAMNLWAILFLNASTSLFLFSDRLVTGKLM